MPECDLPVDGSTRIVFKLAVILVEAGGLSRRGIEREVVFVEIAAFHSSCGGC